MKEKNKISIIVLLAFMISWFFVYRAIRQGRIPSETKISKIEKAEKPTPPQKIDVNLSISPVEAIVHQEEILEIQVLGESEGKIVASDIELSFDPSVLLLKEVKPGSLWVNPFELTKAVDNQKGEVLYGVGALEPNLERGSLAVFKFTVKKISLPQLRTAISFKEGTLVSVLGGETKINLSQEGRYTILKK